MIDATLAFHGMSVFSPWFPRAADMLRVAAECVAVNSAEVEIELYTKNAEETGDGDLVDGTVSITLDTAGQRTTAEWKTMPGQDEGVEQLLRFRYVVTGATPAGNEWILFRLLPAVWFDAVNV